MSRDTNDDPWIFLIILCAVILMFLCAWAVVEASTR
jgi:hypothetical protein